METTMSNQIKTGDIVEYDCNVWHVVQVVKFQGKKYVRLEFPSDPNHQVLALPKGMKRIATWR